MKKIISLFSSMFFILVIAHTSVVSANGNHAETDALEQSLFGEEASAGATKTTAKHAMFFESKVCEAVQSYQKIVKNTEKLKGEITCQVVSSGEKVAQLKSNPNSWDYSSEAFQALLCAESIPEKKGRDLASSDFTKQIVVYRGANTGTLLSDGETLGRDLASISYADEVFADATELNLAGIESAHYAQQIQISHGAGSVCQSDQAVSHQCKSAGKICARIVSVL